MIAAKPTAVISGRMPLLGDASCEATRRHTPSPEGPRKSSTAESMMPKMMMGRDGTDVDEDLRRRQKVRAQEEEDSRRPRKTSARARGRHA